jgi:hypothetical protein
MSQSIRLSTLAGSARVLWECGREEEARAAYRRWAELRKTPQPIWNGPEAVAGPFENSVFALMPQRDMEDIPTTAGPIR